MGIDHCSFIPPKSGVFITLHKCASQFFSRQLLPNLRNRTLIDYQWLHYEDRLHDRVEIHKRGHIYGPVRILDKEHPSYGITEDLLSKCLDDGLKAIIFIRDPRDILVSMYFSFGFGHPLSPQADIREFQLRRRSGIQALDVNAYVVQAAPALLEKFDRISVFCQQAKEKIVLRYEDMCCDFACFYARLNSFVGIRAGIQNKLYRLTRPEKTENLSRHKRLGEPGGFRQKLHHEVIAELNGLFTRVLTDFQYEATDGCPPAGFQP